MLGTSYLSFCAEPLGQAVCLRLSGSLGARVKHEKRDPPLKVETCPSEGFQAKTKKFFLHFLKIYIHTTTTATLSVNSSSFLAFSTTSLLFYWIMEKVPISPHSYTYTRMHTGARTHILTLKTTEWECWRDLQRFPKGAITRTTFYINKGFSTLIHS